MQNGHVERPPLRTVLSRQCLPLEDEAGEKVEVEEDVVEEVKIVMLAQSGCRHSSGESWRLQEPLGQARQPGREQGGEEKQEQPRSSWIDQRCGRQQVWQCSGLQGEEVMKIWREEEVKQRRNERA